MCYNRVNKILFGSGDAGNIPLPELNLFWRQAMNSISSCPHYVYELVDPRDNSIIYVGITINLYERFKQHMHCDGTNPQKDTRIQEILLSGHLPIMRTLERVDSFAQALQKEDYWIWLRGQMGIVLLNAEVACQALGRRAGGRQSNYEKVKEIILYRHFHKKWPDDLSQDMKDHYQFYYFTKPKKAEKSNPKRYAQHVKSYERGRQWIAVEELFDIPPLPPKGA